MDKLIQSVLYASRWILAPIYLGLIGTLVAILLKFYFDVFALLLHIAAIKEKQLVLTVLGLIDLTLVGGLVLMVKKNFRDMVFLLVRLAMDSFLKKRK